MFNSTDLKERQSIKTMPIKLLLDLKKQKTKDYISEGSNAGRVK